MFQHVYLFNSVHTWCILIYSIKFNILHDIVWQNVVWIFILFHKTVRLDNLQYFTSKDPFSSDTCHIFIYSIWYSEINLCYYYNTAIYVTIVILHCHNRLGNNYKMNHMINTVCISSSLPHTIVSERIQDSTWPCIIPAWHSRVIHHMIKPCKKHVIHQ